MEARAFGAIWILSAGFRSSCRAAQRLIVPRPTLGERTTSRRQHGDLAERRGERLFPSGSGRWAHCRSVVLNDGALPFRSGAASR
jgi:hypothetical protein